MVGVLGLDIGGANIKVAYIDQTTPRIATDYFPIWKENKKHLTKILAELTFRLTRGKRLKAVGVTMTAELSDAYSNKHEGVNHILDSVEQTFRNVPIYVLTANGCFFSPKRARHKPLKVAAANWAASGWLIAKHFDSVIFIDVGSTTTTIIPIVNHQVVAEGRTDLDKLANGELVYTGTLRTNIATIVRTIPLRNKMIKISSELFSTSGDIHRILDNITRKKYTGETADGRGKTVKECKARLARVICSDLNMLNNDEIIAITKYVYKKQVEQISGALKQILKRRSMMKKNVFAVTAGIGERFLANKAAERMALKRIHLDRIIKGISKATPASALAIMVDEKYG